MKHTKFEDTPSEELIASEARRILRRLSEPGACLAVAQGMEKAVVVRENKDGQTVRTGTVDAEIAEAMALKGWIGTTGSGRVARYHIKPSGRVALKDMLSEIEVPASEAEEADPRGLRYGTVESPVMMLARRRDKNGEVFLTEDLVRAAERLREDFELARMGDGGGEQNWEEMMAQADAPELDPGVFHGPGVEAARSRVQAAMQDLGPGLGDVVLRACCHLEGMESIEARMGWAARSGKIVLRIGLQRLKRHFKLTQGSLSPMIG
ncbi:DUF6456 domain-containing protein [Palleronia sp. LCG004]|uniref:DUF6456 domain-containing protein n=1 Tax=Palleronia sp. LCG004 TaxID=3079304 RepID=UPI002942D980|nr:DUF6456 domain-containing protein [Palleronia sp. LCG004]WOI56745.1 DUF6456 domain-containing protein [Palleronia sp. LCG004]